MLNGRIIQKIRWLENIAIEANQNETEKFFKNEYNEKKKEQSNSKLVDNYKQPLSV